MRFSLANAAATALSFSLALNASAPQDRLALSYTRYDGERFFGFGQQYTYVDAAGSLVPILAREGGIGRGLEPITSALNAFSRQWGGDERTTYSAVPHYITSSLRSLHLTNTEPCTFDLRHARTVRIEVAATSMRGRILGAASPLALLERTSAFTGRQPPLPAWSHTRGVTIGIQGGTARVAELTQRMLRANVSLSGVWLQDWGGVYAQTILGMEQIRLKWNWRLDTALYPRWDELVANLSDSGGARRCCARPDAPRGAGARRSAKASTQPLGAVAAQSRFAPLHFCGRSSRDHLPRSRLAPSPTR
jgi:alpha-glucosidase